jgi:hypothetical protein
MKVKVIRGTVKYGAEYNAKSKAVEGEKSAGPGEVIDLEDSEAQRLTEREFVVAADAPVAAAVAAVGVSEQSTGGVSQSPGGTGSLLP